MALILKEYQTQTLDALKHYLEQSLFYGPKQAYDQIQTKRYGQEPFKPYAPLEGLEPTPYVCLRLPTGGGKTLLSAHTVKLAGQSYLNKDYPVTLWLVPTDIIKQQTLETLKKPNHPNREVLEKAFDGRFRVFDIADFRQIRPQDLKDSACIVVSTFAALRVDKTEGRKVYAHDENLEPHFSKIPSHTQGMERDETTNQLKFSFANLLHWHRPLVIVDEAHNAKSDLSIEVLRRVNAACIVEYTATPAKNSNVIYSVTAAELKAEQMIKLPIILHSDHISWEQAIIGSIQTRQKLEDLAVKDKDYIRPIILFQAENKDKEITVEKIKTYLIENENIPVEQIAIATGDQRELDNINLFDPSCPIRYVITVQALKEGWDCSFAYVLCSVANTQSSVAVEQLLGRVLRMPYAKNREEKELNKAHAHVSSQSWPNATSKLKDNLISMGFEEQEAEQFVYSQPTTNGAQKSVFQATLVEEPDLTNLTPDEKTKVIIDKTPLGFYTLSVNTNNLDDELIEKLKEVPRSKEAKREITLRLEQAKKQKKENQTPSEKGEIFSIPQLCLKFEDGDELAEKELFLAEDGWNLLDYPTIIGPEEFSIDEDSKQYAVDLDGNKITIHQLEESQQLSIDTITTDMDENALCKWFDKRLHQIDINQQVLLEFLRRTINHLTARSDMNLPKINRAKFVLEKLLSQKITQYRQQAYEKGYQGCLFGPNAIASINEKAFSFKFDPNVYPVNDYFDGSFRFKKHYYPSVAAMNKEETQCAQAIDSHPQVEFWVRNLERQPEHAFWLPTHTDRFYPDFVAKLTNGRLLVVEYKGEHLKGPDSQEKQLLGQVWAEKSGNLFLMAWKNDNGLNVNEQIKKILGS